MAGLTKAQIAERKAAEEAARAVELETLKLELATAKAEAEEAHKRAEWYEEQDRKTQLDDDLPTIASAPADTGVAPTPVLGDPSVFVDPYESQNPHKFLSFPPGFALSWKSPIYRDGSRGWRGWLPVTYDSEIGRNLSRYLLDPPKRMQHAIDNVVRRGDSVLSYIEADLHNGRLNARTNKALARVGEHAEDLRVDRIRSVSDFSPSPHSANSIGGRSLTSK